MSRLAVPIEELCLLAIASGTISLVITRSHLTKTMRHWLIDVRFLMVGELVNCPWCMAFWTSIPMAFTLDSEGLHFWPASWLVITGLSGLYMGLMMKLWLFREDELESMRDLLREARDQMGERQ